MAVPQMCGLLSPNELSITQDYEAPALVQALAARALTAVDVVTAFAKRAAIAHQLTGCLCDFFLDEAIERAQALDMHLATTGQVVGPLHGLPVSIKDLLDMQGHKSGTGFIGDIRDAPSDGHLVSVLRRLGAVFYVKTCQPQGIMHLEGDGFLYRVLNPHNIHLSAGGSSSGEAALVAMRGSVLGVGTDIGGSVRGPAAFVGIWGWKPTTRILPRYGAQTHRFTAALTIDSTCGPMSTSLGGVDLFMTSVLSTKPHREDGTLMPALWAPFHSPLQRPVVAAAAQAPPLRVGIMMDDGHTIPQPPVTEAMEWAAQLLGKAAAAGGSAPAIQVVPYAPLKAAEAFEKMRSRYYWSCGTGILRQMLRETGEPELPLTTAAWEGVQEHQLVATEVLQYVAEINAYRKDFIQDWHRQGVDVVLCPAYVGPASMHDEGDNWVYTAVWNLVNYPGVVFPTPVTVSGDKSKHAYRDPQRASSLSSRSAAAKAQWEKGDYECAPINLQLVAPYGCDHDLWKALQLLAPILALKY